MLEVLAAELVGEVAEVLRAGTEEPQVRVCRRQLLVQPFDDGAVVGGQSADGDVTLSGSGRRLGCEG